MRTASPPPRPPQCCPCWTRRAQRPPPRQSPPVCPPAPAGGILMASGAPTLAPVVLRRRHLSRNTPWAWVWSPGPCPWTHKARDSAPGTRGAPHRRASAPPAEPISGGGELDTGLAQAWRPVPRRGGEEDRAAAVGMEGSSSVGRHARSAPAVGTHAASRPRWAAGPGGGQPRRVPQTVGPLLTQQTPPEGPPDSATCGWRLRGSGPGRLGRSRCRRDLPAPHLPCGQAGQRPLS